MRMYLDWVLWSVNILKDIVNIDIECDIDDKM